MTSFESSTWSMRSSRSDIKHPRWSSLNDDLRIWERGFELEHRRPPTRDDVSARTYILDMYVERSKLEDELLSEIAPGFRIGRATSMSQQKLIALPERETPPLEVERPREVNLFAEDSSFADYFVGLPQQPRPSLSSSSIITPSATSNSLFQSTEIPTGVLAHSGSRPSLSTLMTSSTGIYHNSSQSNSSSGSHTSIGLMPQGEELRPQFDFSQASMTSVIGSEDSLMDGVSFDEDIHLQPEDMDASQEQSPRHSVDLHDNDTQLDLDPGLSNDLTTYSRTMDASDNGEEEEVKLPGFWSSRPSLADSLRESSAIGIIEDDRARFSFDDNIDEDDLPTASAVIPPARESKSSKKRKRNPTLIGDENVDSTDDQKESSNAASSSNKRSVKKSKSSSIEIFDELSSASAPATSSGKRQNYRKLNLKNGYKKPKMDRDMMSMAAARKRAESRVVVGTELTPFDIIDENTAVDGLVSPLVAGRSDSKQGGTMDAAQALSASREAVLKMMANKDHTYTEEEWKEACMALLVQHFGNTSFREGQFEAIWRVLSGKNTLLIVPTGGGKSLCFQFPSLCFDGGITLVVSPLLSLISDQLTKLASTSLVGVALTSSMNPTATREALDKLRSGEAHILFISPEKLASQSFLELFKLLALRINLVCVDEAHCVSTWSHNFRPSYLSIYKHAVETLGARCVLSLTATATAMTRDAICENLHIAKDGVLRFAPLSETIQLNIKMLQEKQTVLEKFLKSPELSGNASVIIYVMFQKQADDVALYLQQRGFSTAAYHAGKSPTERNRVQNLFLSHKVKILVATVAFGMGIDQRDIRCVIHYSLPKSVENYVQEVGRAGRDGEPAFCHLLFNQSDLLTLHSLAHADTQDRATIRSFLMTIWPSTSQTNSGQRRQVLLPIASSEKKYDMKQSLITTILTWLANDHKLIVKPQMDSKCEISFFEKSLDVLKSKSKLLAQCAVVGTKTKSVLTVPLDALAIARGTNLETIVSQLNEAAEKLHLTLAFKDPAFHLEILDELQHEDDLDHTIDNIVKRIKQLETVALDKLNALYRIVTQDLDQSMHLKLKQYFDAEPTPESTNTVYKTTKIPPSAIALIAPDIKAFLSNYADDISTARQVARIFHAISSPQFPKEEWQRTRFWGSAVSTPFEVVLQAAQDELIASMTL